jgi:hypothetical protein
MFGWLDGWMCYVLKVGWLGFLDSWMLGWLDFLDRLDGLKVGWLDVGWLEGWIVGCWMV